MGEALPAGERPTHGALFSTIRRKARSRGAGRCGLDFFLSGAQTEHS